MARVSRFPAGSWPPGARADARAAVTLPSVLAPPAEPAWCSAWPMCPSLFRSPFPLDKMWPVPSLACPSALVLWRWQGEILCWFEALLGTPS